jgi:hypothetical protein
VLNSPKTVYFSDMAFFENVIKPPSGKGIGITGGY